MAPALSFPLVLRSHVTAWGFLVALTLGLWLLFAGVLTINVPLLPRRLWVFVEPPSWILGALLLGFAGFLFLVGVAELARFVRPSTELVVDYEGIRTYGLLGERRIAWEDMVASDVRPGSLSIRLRRHGRMARPALNIHFDRIDGGPATLIAAIRSQRPDLVPRGSLPLGA